MTWLTCLARRHHHDSRVRAVGSCVLGLSALALLLTPLAACSVSQDGILPPKARIFLPEGGLVDGRWLYVVNSNSDLRYNDGTLAVVDLDMVVADRTPERAMQWPWPDCPSDSRYVPDASAPHGCCRDFLDRSILNCDEQAYVKSDATIRIGSFGGRPVVHKTTNGQRRLLIPVRGDSSITMVHVDDSDAEHPRFICTGPAPERCGSPPSVQQPDFAECAEEWRIDKFLPASATSSLTDLEGLNIRLPEEPYGIAIDNTQQLLYVGHLQNGRISLIDLDAAPSPRLITVFDSAVPPSANGARGITSLTTTGDSGPIFVTSRFRPVVSSILTVGVSAKAPTCDTLAAANEKCDPRSSEPDTNVKCNGARDLAVVGRQEIMDTGFTSGSETRGVVFSDDQKTAWVLQRNPPAVVAIDRSPSSLTGLPLDIPSGVIEVCANPAFMEAHEAADGLMLFVSCFDTGEIYVVSAEENRVRDVIEVGRGPAGMVFGARKAGPGPDFGYVLGFGANNVSVVDVQAGSSSRHRVVQRIGFPSPTPRAFVP